jgi:hypothetical protein
LSFAADSPVVPQLLEEASQKGRFTMSQVAPRRKKDGEIVGSPEDAPAAVPAKTPTVVVSDAAIERLADEIHTLTREAKRVYVLAVGRLVMERFYGGDVALFRSRGHTKDVSIRRLAVRLEAIDTMKATTLYRCLTCYEFVQRTPSVSALKHIGVGHLYAVLVLPEPLREQVLLRADAERWTTRRTQIESAAQRPARNRRHTASRRQRNGKPRFVGEVASLRPFVQDEEWLSDIGRCGEVGIDELREALGVMTCMGHRIEEATTRLRMELTRKEASDERRGPSRR